MPAFIPVIGLPVAAVRFLCCLMFSVENFLDKDYNAGSKGQTLCHTHTHTHTHTQTHHYYSPWRRSTCSIAVRLIQHRSWVRSLCVSVFRVLLQDDSFTRSSAKVHESGCEAAPAEFKLCFIRVTRVEASCLSFSVSACESRSWIRLESDRVESQVQLTFNFIQMNSWLFGGIGRESCWTLCWVLLALSGTRQLFGGADSKGSPHHSRGFVVQ